jgi:hypothetical protein
VADEPQTGSDVAEPSLDARGVAQRLAALPERQMRTARLREIVLGCTPADAAWLLDTLATAGRAGGPPFDVSLIAAVDLAGGETLPYDSRRAIFEAASGLQLLACKELLLSESDTAEEQPTAPRPLVPGTRPLTLGERKALARSWDRDVLERLVTDPHTDVVRLLLGNPHLTETDILRIATSRRSSAEVLGLVLQSRRWGISPRVRKALVRNPNLPVATSLRLIGLLNRTDLQELAADPQLPNSVRASLQRRLRPPS